LEKYHAFQPLLTKMTEGGGCLMFKKRRSSAGAQIQCEGKSESVLAIDGHIFNSRISNNNF
jgi:hypothetical protein